MEDLKTFDFFIICHDSLLENSLPYSIICLSHTSPLHHEISTEFHPCHTHVLNRMVLCFAFLAIRRLDGQDGVMKEGMGVFGALGAHHMSRGHG